MGADWETELRHESEQNRGVFFLSRAGHRAAELTYEISPERVMYIQHVYVSEALRGSGFGLRLVRNAIEFARSRELQVVPLCWFASKVMDADPKLRDEVRRASGTSA